MDLFNLALISLFSGIVVGILSRIDKLKPLALIFGIGTGIALVVFVGNFLNYVANPTIDGLYAFIASLVPFAVGSAFAAKGEELVKSFGKRY